MASLPPTPDSELGQARALFAYEAQDETCIDLKPGDVINLLQVDDGPWWKGTIGTRTGWFPSSFVDLISKNVPHTPTSNTNRPRSVKYRPNTFQVKPVGERLNATAPSAVNFGGSRLVDVQSTQPSSSATPPLPANKTNHPQNRAAPPSPSANGGGISQMKLRTGGVILAERPETQRVHQAVKEEEVVRIGWKETVLYYLDREGADYLFFFVYILFNAVYFGITVEEYRKRKSYDILGSGLTMARGTGALLKMNCSFIFLPVCRGLITWLRGFPTASKLLPLDSNLKIHKMMAYWIWILGTTHSVAHFFNFRKLSVISHETFEEYFPTVHQYTSFGEWAFLTLPGFSGVLLWVVQMLLYSSALKNCRHASFEVFWFVHHLFVVFTVLNLIHGAAAVFEPPGFWKWFIGPGVLYSLERLKREIKGARATHLHHITGENSGVIALFMERKRNFRYIPGQYLFLNCPALSKYQWHPFTITSCPEEKYLSVHIKAVGGWTNGLMKLLNPEKAVGFKLIDKSNDQIGRPILRVDGPFGAPSEHVWDSRVAVLIGAGIGVTPFASILKSMFYKLLLAQAAPKEYDLELMRVQKVHFYWICRDRSSFEWFAYLLRDLEVRSEGFLEVHTYITQRFQLDQIKTYVSSAYTNPNELDDLTGLRTRTYFGRPDFPLIFQDMATQYPKEKIGVFFCGPKVMSNAIKRATSEASTVGGTQFTFRKENF